MICPHCGVGVNIDWSQEDATLFDNNDIFIKGNAMQYGFCSECKGFILYVYEGEGYKEDYPDGSFLRLTKPILSYPKYASVRNLPNIIPNNYLSLFKEAEQVMQISPRSSATLSRFLLQGLFHEELKIKKGNLEQEIQAFSERADVPSKLGSMLQVMRKIANFAAHPKKSTNSNEIIDVNKGEAEIMLDLIYEVFDYVFIKPSQQKEFLASAKDRYGIEI